MPKGQITGLCDISSGKYQTGPWDLDHINLKFRFDSRL